jgi:hypothetical protein
MAPVDKRERLEAQVPLQQRQRHGLERSDDKGCTHRHDDEGQLWSVEETPQRDRHHALVLRVRNTSLAKRQGADRHRPCNGPFPP